LAEARPKVVNNNFAADARDEVELAQVQVKGKQAVLQEAQARLEQATATQKRLQQLGNEKAVSQEEVQRALSEVQVLRAQLDAKKAELMEAEVRLAQAQRRLKDNQASPPDKAKHPASDNFGSLRVFRLKYANAADTSNIIDSIFQGKGVRVVADRGRTALLPVGATAIRCGHLKPC